MSPLPHVATRRIASGPVPEPRRDPEIPEGYLEDASGNPAGSASGLLRPASEEEAAAFLESSSGLGVSILPQAARSSLTGGATPNGEVVVSVERLNSIGPIEGSGSGARITVGAGVRLRDLQAELRTRGFYYPPVPTYQEAMIGGTVSTNAGGSASFKYGVTRQWVRGLRVLLGSGELLEIERGRAGAPRGGVFRIERVDGSKTTVPTPTHRLPDLKKISAGYFSSDPLDLVDLFVGSEGTLGLITAVTLDLVPLPPSVVTGLVFAPSRRRALDLARALREEAIRARSEADDRGADIRAIELMDGRCLDLLRAGGVASRLRVAIPAEAGSALVFEMELPGETTNAEAEDVLSRFFDGEEPGGPLSTLFSILDRHGALDGIELALPEDESRQSALLEVREAVPKLLNELLRERRRADPAVRKVGGDLIVPFERLGEMIDLYERGFESRGLAYAIWGHVSDGNLHPNAIPRSAAEVVSGHEALHDFAGEAAKRGGCPLSEHGVGRSPLKQEMLRRFLGADAIDSMRAVKRALDPEGRMAPGVIFPPTA